MKYDIKPEELERITPASYFNDRTNTINNQISIKSVSVVRKAVKVLEADPMKTEVVYAIGDDALHRMIARRAVRIARRKGYHARWQIDCDQVQLVISLKPLGIPALSDALCIELFCAALVVGVIMVILWEVGIL